MRGRNLSVGRAVPPAALRVVSSSGRALEPETRSEMEGRFGHDFSRIRVHDDAEAADAAERLAARAFTVGRHVVFGRGEYAPAFAQSRRLLAHELAHTVQQEGAEARATLALSDPHAEHEHASEEAGRAVMENQPLAPLGRAPLQIARQPKPDADADTDADEAEAPPVDVMKGAVVSEIVVGLGNSRTAFRTSKGIVLGTVDSDLEQGSYIVEPDFESHDWIITDEGVLSGMRFWVELEGADPWTMSYPKKLPLTVSDGPLLTETEAKEQEQAEADERADVRHSVEALEEPQFREKWSERREDFLRAAADPDNKLSGRQMYQIWLRLWMERQNKANAELNELESRLRAEAKAEGGDAFAIFVDKKMMYDKGKADALGPEYEAVAARKETIDFVFSDIKDVLFWLEAWVDAAGHHVTLQQVNAKALEIARDKAWFRTYMEPIILGVVGLGAAGRGRSSSARATRAVVEEPAVKLEPRAADPVTVPEPPRVANPPKPPRAVAPADPARVAEPPKVGEPVKVAEPPKAASVRPATRIEEGRRIRARKAARKSEAPVESEERMASSDRARASSGRGPRRGGGTGADGGEDVEPPRQRTESSGKGETNIPPETPPVKVEWKARGAAIEQRHLDSMPEYSRPREGNFSGIDAWKAPESDTTRTRPDGMRVRTISGPDVLQVKSVGSARPADIASNVNTGIANLESQTYRNRSGTVRVIRPRSMTLDIVFDESAVPHVTPEIRATLRHHSETAGRKGILIRWFRLSADSIVAIPVE